LQKKLKRVAVLEHQCETGTVEIWVDIADFEGRYQISNFGRVKSLSRTRKGKNNCLVPVAEKIMKLHIKQDNGRQRPYAEVCLRNGSVRTVHGKQKLVHRLVAHAFIKPLEDGEQVDHINGNHNDNQVENLRVMKTIEHSRIHPIVLNPLERDMKNGQFLSRNT
jgi:hypothetical protein